MRHPGRAYPINESAMVVLPDPDSPISATTSPRATEKLTVLTMSVSSPLSLRATTRRPWTSTSPATSASLRSEPTTAREIVDQQVDADRQSGDRTSWHE